MSSTSKIHNHLNFLKIYIVVIIIIFISLFKKNKPYKNFSQIMYIFKKKYKKQLS